MREKNPIFINAFAHGGSNILWNIFQSHPNVCSPVYETHELFQKKKIRTCLFAMLNGERNFFVTKELKPRKIYFNLSVKYIDDTLHQAKLMNAKHQYNKYKDEDTLYNYIDIKNSRLVAKNLNGIIFLSDVLAKIYPNAIFVNLIRDPVALYEGYLRRGLFNSPVEFAEFYKIIVQEMIRIKDKYNSFFVRFEDIIKDPINMVERIYKQSNLSIHEINKVRLKLKPHYQDREKRETEYPKGTKKWFRLKELPKIITSKVNKYQIELINDNDKKIILEQLERLLLKLNYL